VLDPFVLVPRLTSSTSTISLSTSTSTKEDKDGNENRNKNGNKGRRSRALKSRRALERAGPLPCSAPSYNRF
jgi:hypothetical protein